MSRFEWLKDNLKVAVASLLVAVIGVLVAFLSLTNDVFGGRAVSSTPEITSAAVPRTPSPSSDVSRSAGPGPSIE